MEKKCGCTTKCTCGCQEGKNVLARVNVLAKTKKKQRKNVVVKNRDKSK